MKKMLLAGVILAMIFAGANAAEAPTIQDAPSWLTNKAYPPPNDGVDLYHPEKYGTPEQQKIPNPFRLIPGVAQAQTYYVYPTMQDAPAWLTRKYKKKPRMYR
jgi:hypothetical protein